MTLMSAEKLAEDLTHGELLAELRYLRVGIDYLKSSDSTQEKAKIIYMKGTILEFFRVFSSSVFCSDDSER